MATQSKQGILLESGTNELEIIEVFIDEENGYRGHYGINVAKVIEIINMPDKVTTPPSAASFVHGVFNHRGKVIMILDLAKWLGRVQTGSNNRIAIITEFNDITSAFLVTGVTRIHRTSWANIKPLDGYLQNLCNAITGTILLEGKTVLMLDLERAIGELDPRLSDPGAAKKEKEKEEIHPDTLHTRKAVLETPRSEAPRPEVTHTEVAHTETDTPGTKRPLKILHADDSKMIRTSVKRLLEADQECIVQSMVDGKQAWDYLEELKQKAANEQKSINEFIDLILSDIEMPEMDGYHLCQRVKCDPDLQSIPVALFSSLINDKVRHKGESVGADAQYTKPGPAGLVNDLKELLNRR